MDEKLKEKNRYLVTVNEVRIGDVTLYDYWIFLLDYFFTPNSSGTVLFNFMGNLKKT